LVPNTTYILSKTIVKDGEGMKAIGVDIGGTGVKASLIDEQGNVYKQAKISTNIAEGREGILRSCFSVIDSLLYEAGDIAGIGVGTAGRVDVEKGEIVYATANLPSWQGTKLTQIISERYQLDSFIENDANAALIGEIWQGAKVNVHSVTMLTLGTGVGGANVVEGKMVHGHHHQSGEWGHVVLVPNGRPCNCGMKGCLEQYLSGSALVRITNEQTGLAFTHGKEVLEAYSTGNELVRPVVEQFLDYLAIAIYNLSVSIDPEAVIVGGGVIDSKEHWWHVLENKLKDYNVFTTILPARLGNEAGMYGAAKLVFDALKKRGEFL
jgi:glucokinase